MFITFNILITGAPMFKDMKTILKYTFYVCKTKYFKQFYQIVILYIMISINVYSGTLNLS